MYRGWADGLRELGCEVALYNTNDLERLLFYSSALIDSGEKDETGHPIVRQAMTQPEAIRASMQGLSHAAYTFWPDCILFVSAFFVTADAFSLLRLRRHKIILLHSESPYQDTEQLTRAPFADLNLLNDPTNIKAYTDLGVPALYMPHAYRPELHHPRTGPRNLELAADLTFIGTAFQSRIAFFEAMDFTGIDFLLGGSYWDEDLPPRSPLRRYLSQDKACVDNTETAELYRHAKCGINLYRQESEDDHRGEGWAMGPREVELAATGLWFARDARPESDQVFPMLPSFTTPREASDLIRWALAHDREREAAATAARAAIADRTFAGNAAKLLRALDEL
jgi:spore maturation protein CgeB